MSIQIMSRVFELRRLGSPARRVVLLALANHASGDGKGIWASHNKLAQETDVSKRTVQRIVADCVACGLLIEVRKGGKRPGDANEWDMDLMVLARIEAGADIDGLISERARRTAERTEVEPGAGCYGGHSDHGGHGDHHSMVDMVTMVDTKDGYGGHGDHQTLIYKYTTTQTAGAGASAVYSGLLEEGVAGLDENKPAGDNPGDNRGRLAVGRQGGGEHGQLLARFARLTAAVGDRLADGEYYGAVLMPARLDAWLKAGADYELDILPAVTARARKKRRGSITTWSYFDQVVADAVALRQAGLPAASASVVRACAARGDGWTEGEAAHAALRGKDRAAVVARFQAEMERQAALAAEDDGSGLQQLIDANSEDIRRINDARRGARRGASSAAGGPSREQQ